MLESGAADGSATAAKTADMATMDVASVVVAMDVEARAAVATGMEMSSPKGDAPWRAIVAGGAGVLGFSGDPFRLPGRDGACHP